MPPTPPDFPLRVVNSAAPVRVCDNGGWTDTWFAGRGAVFNIAVRPCVEVQLAVHPRSARPDAVLLDVEDFGDRYAVPPGGPPPGRHPLLEAAIDLLPPPADVALEIAISSEVPAGCSTGTSAAVTVALLAALDALTPGRRTAHELAALAHRVETERLKLQCGIQDQLCAAYGGISYIEMFHYPHASVSPVRVPEAVWWELERRLVLVYLGRAHSSSAVHQKVIAELEREGGSSPRLAGLRRTAERSRDAVAAGDFAALGRVMAENTDLQAALHPDLVSPGARRLIELAKAHGAVGWKVNGAGGDGGSVTLLCGPSAGARRALLRAIPAADPRHRVIPTRLSRSGVRVWDG